MIADHRLAPAMQLAIRARQAQLGDKKTSDHASSLLTWKVLRKNSAVRLMAWRSPPSTRTPMTTRASMHRSGSCACTSASALMTLDLDAESQSQSHLSGPFPGFDALDRCCRPQHCQQMAMTSQDCLEKLGI